METNLHDYMCVPILSFEHFVNLSSNLSLFKESRDHILCRSKQPHYHSHIAKLSLSVASKVGIENRHATPSQLLELC